MRLTKNDIDMLYRFGLSEHFTSPSEPAPYDRAPVIEKLKKAQLIRHDGARLLLTAAGNEVLDAKLNNPRASILRQVRARHGKH